MSKHIPLFLGLSLPLLATEMPPVIPAGPVTYDDVTYVGTPTQTTDTAVPHPTYTEPLTPASGGETPFELGINLYTSNYQVRGMGVTDTLSSYGWSSVGGAYTLPNRNLFNRGIYTRLGGDFGIIWGSGDALGDTPKFDADAAMGKEIFPNLTLEGGYAIHRGGLEGYMAKCFGSAAHRVSQDLNFRLAFNDQQRGFFGHAVWGYGFQGLTGHFFDIEAGYRFTQVLRTPQADADLEISAGIAPSLGYWGAGVEGIDAYRLRAAFVPNTHNGKLGRDAAWQLKPWIQFSWSGSNAGKIDRVTGCGPIDHFQITVGIEGGFRF